MKCTLIAGLLVAASSCGAEPGPADAELFMAKKEVGKPKKKKKKKRPMKPVPGPIDGGMARPSLPSYAPLS